MLGILLYATFLGVPFSRIGRAFRDWRFLAAVLTVNFLLVPIAVWPLSRIVAHDEAILIGVLFVLLTPCVDYVIVFTGLAGGAKDRLLAATPLLMLGQMLLLPLYLRLFMGAGVAQAVDPKPFVEAFLLLIVLPLLADGTITQGGYSQAIVTDESFVLSIPAALDPAKAAPLLCAGIATYSPLRHWGAGPGKRVAILGMGGLGHMGVKIAAALGAEVTVHSRGAKKRDDALAFGASRYVDTTDVAALNELRGSLDLILNTVSAGLKISSYLRLLDVDGALVNVGAPSEPFTVPAFSLIPARRTLAGSTTGGIPETQEMLEFCARHGIHPETELVAAESINEAWERVLAADVRYRFVIDAHTL